MRSLATLLTLLLPAAALAQAIPAPAVDPAKVEAVVTATFSGAPADWKPRVTQDATQRQCSILRNEPTGAAYDAILAREKANVVLPADGQVMGDWKRGQRVAQYGRGGQFSDAADAERGGNCYACHQMSAAEVSYGTLGPSLLHYGKDRSFDPAEARQAYVKIYNPQSVMPCSMMPRFGHNGVLTEKQIKDVVAYLFDRDSPVNK